MFRWLRVLLSSMIFFNHRNPVYLWDNKYRMMRGPSHHLQDNELLCGRTGWNSQGNYLKDALVRSHLLCDRLGITLSLKTRVRIEKYIYIYILFMLNTHAFSFYLKNSRILINFILGPIGSWPPPSSPALQFLFLLVHCGILYQTLSLYSKS